MGGCVAEAVEEDEDVVVRGGRGGGWWWGVVVRGARVGDYHGHGGGEVLCDGDFGWHFSSLFFFAICCPVVWWLFVHLGNWRLIDCLV